MKVSWIGYIIIPKDGIIQPANTITKFKAHGIEAIKQVKGGKMDKLTWIINSWDPTNLMSHAPAEEYHLEIQMIADLLKKPMMKMN